MSADRPSYSSHWRRDLKRIDSSYDFRFKNGRWQVVRYVDLPGQEQGAVILHWVQNEDGSYRPIDQRVIFHMRRQTFLSRHPGYKDRAARRDAEWTEKARQDGQRELQDRIDETKHMDKNRVYYYEGCMG